MSVSTTRIEHDASLGSHLAVHKMPAHWLMARLGKRVLRPGGIETTRWLLKHGRIGPDDDVVELAPGLGITANAILAHGPKSYMGIERDADAFRRAEQAVTRAGVPGASVRQGDAAVVPLPDGCASVVMGEAMLSMQLLAKKRAIISEARRLLRRDGRYLIHELALQPDNIDGSRFERIQTDLSSVIHVGVRIGTCGEWQGWLAEAGFEVEHLTTAPMRLLEPDRMLRDEGLLGMSRFAFNVLRTPGAAERLLSVRRMFRKHQDHLSAIAIVARRRA